MKVHKLIAECKKLELELQEQDPDPESFEHHVLQNLANVASTLRNIPADQAREHSLFVLNTLIEEASEAAPGLVKVLKALKRKVDRMG